MEPTHNESNPPNKYVDDDGVLSDYACVCISYWLEFELWESREACCILADINPYAVDINWDNTLLGPGMQYEWPELRGASLFTESEYISLPLYDEDGGTPLWSADQIESFETADSRVRRIWKLFLRTTDFQPDTSSGSSPSSYVEWAKRRNLKITWLKWAETRKLISTPSEQTTNSSRKPDKRAKDSRLAFIGALLASKNIDPNSANMKELIGLTEDFGAPLSRNTISAILNEISSAAVEVQDRKRVNK